MDATRKRRAGGSIAALSPTAATPCGAAAGLAPEWHSTGTHQHHKLGHSRGDVGGTAPIGGGSTTAASVIETDEELARRLHRELNSVLPRIVTTRRASRLPSELAVSCSPRTAKQHDVPSAASTPTIVDLGSRAGRDGHVGVTSSSHGEHNSHQKAAAASGRQQFGAHTGRVDHRASRNDGGGDSKEGGTRRAAGGSHPGVGGMASAACAGVPQRMKVDVRRVDDDDGRDGVTCASAKASSRHPTSSTRKPSSTIKELQALLADGLGEATAATCRTGEPVTSPVRPSRAQRVLEAAVTAVGGKDGTSSDEHHCQPQRRRVTSPDRGNSTGTAGHKHHPQRSQRSRTTAAAADEAAEEQLGRSLRSSRQGATAGHCNSARQAGPAAVASGGPNAALAPARLHGATRGSSHLSVDLDVGGTDQPSLTAVHLPLDSSAGSEDLAVHLPLGSAAEKATSSNVDCVATIITPRGLPSDRLGVECHEHDDDCCAGGSSAAVLPAVSDADADGGDQAITCRVTVQLAGRGQEHGSSELKRGGAAVTARDSGKVASAVVKLPGKGADDVALADVGGTGGTTTADEDGGEVGEHEEEEEVEEEEAEEEVPRRSAARNRSLARIKVPKLPMVLYEGRWYRARLMRDGSQKVQLEVAGLEALTGPFWLPRDSERIWRGSYKGRDWRHLGGGAWEPKSRKNGAANHHASRHRHGHGGGSRRAAKRRAAREATSEEEEEDEQQEEDEEVDEDAASCGAVKPEVKPEPEDCKPSDAVAPRTSHHKRQHVATGAGTTHTCEGVKPEAGAAVAATTEEGAALGGTEGEQHHHQRPVRNRCAPKWRDVMIGEATHAPHARGGTAGAAAAGAGAPGVARVQGHGRSAGGMAASSLAGRRRMSESAPAELDDRHAEEGAHAVAVAAAAVASVAEDGAVAVLCAEEAGGMAAGRSTGGRRGGLAVHVPSRQASLQPIGSAMDSLLLATVSPRSRRKGRPVRSRLEDDLLTYTEVELPPAKVACGTVASGDHHHACEKRHSCGTAGAHVAPGSTGLKAERDMTASAGHLGWKGAWKGAWKQRTGHGGSNAGGWAATDAVISPVASHSSEEDEEADAATAACELLLQIKQPRGRVSITGGGVDDTAGRKEGLAGRPAGLARGKKRPARYSDKAFEDGDALDDDDETAPAALPVDGANSDTPPAVAPSRAPSSRRKLNGQPIGATCATAAASHPSSHPHTQWDDVAAHCSVEEVVGGTLPSCEPRRRPSHDSGTLALSALSAGQAGVGELLRRTSSSTAATTTTLEEFRCVLDAVGELQQKGGLPLLGATPPIWRTKLISLVGSAVSSGKADGTLQPAAGGALSGTGVDVGHECALSAARLMPCSAHATPAVSGDVVGSTASAVQVGGTTTLAGHTAAPPLSSSMLTFLPTVDSVQHMMLTARWRDAAALSCGPASGTHALDSAALSMRVPLFK